MLLNITIAVLFLCASIMLTWVVWKTMTPKYNTWWDPEEHAINWFLDVRKGLLALSDDERKALLQRWKGEVSSPPLFHSVNLTVEQKLQAKELRKILTPRKDFAT